MVLDRKTINLLTSFAGVTAILFVIFTLWSVSTIPKSFPVGVNFVVGEGESLRSISTRLENENYISSALLFRVWVSFLGRDRHVQLGVYSFSRPISLDGIVARLVSGSPDAPLVSITVPEGSTTEEIAKIIKKVMPNFSIDIFNAKVIEKNANGRLFPSTYYLLPSDSESDIIDIMTATFIKKYKTSFGNTEIPAPLKNQNGVISLASILEGEAKTVEDMKIVSGIIQKRISLSMPIQVDVAKVTYTTKGLPENPVSNPGLVALDAAFHPESSDYLYYLTGKDGQMHYSKTFEEHKRNIQKYLK